MKGEASYKPGKRGGDGEWREGHASLGCEVGGGSAMWGGRREQAMPPEAAECPGWCASLPFHPPLPLW